MRNDIERRYEVKEKYADQLFGGETDTSYIEDCMKNGIPEEDLMELYREWGSEALEMVVIDDDQTVVSGLDIDGQPTLHIGTWDEYRRSVSEAADMLYEAYNPDYKGEDPEELMDIYGYPWGFANQVCEKINEMIKERDEEE